MLEFLIISAAFGWFFFVLYSPRFDYLDGEREVIKQQELDKEKK